MMKRVLPFIFLAGAFGSFILLWTIPGALRDHNFELREWVYIVLAAMLLLCLFIGLILILRWIPVAVLKFILIILTSLGLLVVLGASVYLGLFAHRPEHVVIRNDKKYVAVVTAWLDTDVDYYPYVNAFVYKTPAEITESYGDGAFDPLKKGEENMHHPRQTWYNDEQGFRIERYDEEGNPIVSPE